MVISQITQGQHVRDIILRLKKKDGTMGLIEFSALSKGKTGFGSPESYTKTNSRNIGIDGAPLPPSLRPRIE